MSPLRIRSGAFFVYLTKNCKNYTEKHDLLKKQGYDIQSKLIWSREVLRPPFLVDLKFNLDYHEKIICVYNTNER